MQKINWTVLIIAVIVAIAIFVTSLILFPSWGASIASLLALAGAVIVGVTNFFSNFAKTFLKQSSSSASSESPPTHKPSVNVSGNLLVGKNKINVARPDTNVSDNPMLGENEINVKDEFTSKGKKK